MFVREILHRKGHEIKTLRPDDPLEQGAAHMKLERVGALVVCGEDKKLKGVLSERDVVNAVVDYGARALQMKASEAMDTRPVTCSPDDTIATVARKMTLARVRHVPVVEDGEIRGIVSIGDIVKERFEEMELERNTLRDLAGAHSVA